MHVCLKNTEVRVWKISIFNNSLQRAKTDVIMVKNFVKKCILIMYSTLRKLRLFIKGKFINMWQVGTSLSISTITSVSPLPEAYTLVHQNTEFEVYVDL